MAQELSDTQSESQILSESFDAEAELRAFLADSALSELKMPPMTTGQRKHTKKIAEQFPELACESYGFGQERQLHFFKKGTRASSKKSLRETPEKTGCESGQTSRSNTPEPPTIILSPAPSPNCQGVPLQPHASFRVRNTFIHIETGGDAANDDRAIRSMPHGMFSQCLLQESESTCPAAPMAAELTGTTGPPHLATEVAEIPLGSEVYVEGLVKCPAFNGRRGVALSFDVESARYNVLLADRQMAKIKAENLRSAAPPDPIFEASAPELVPCFPPTPTWQDRPAYSVPVKCQAR